MISISDTAQIDVGEVTREQFNKFERQERRIRLEERQERLEKLRLPRELKDALALSS